MERECASCKLLLRITLTIPLPPSDYGPMLLHEVSQAGFAAFIRFLGLLVLEIGRKRCPFIVAQILSGAVWATLPVT